MTTPTITQLEEQQLRESFNEHIALWVDTGKTDEKGRRIVRNLDTQQEQVFEDHK